MKTDAVLGISEEGFHDIVYTEWGAPSELPTIICVHGYTRNRHDFDALSEYLTNQERHIFCPDIVGRGDSSWFKESNHYNFNQYVSDMNALIARTGAHAIDWIGTSMGGIIGMMLAALPNSPIHKLILNDVGAQIPVHALRKLAEYIGKEPAFKSIEDAKAYYKKTYGGFGKLTEEQWDFFTQSSITQTKPNQFVVKSDPAIKNPKSTMHFIGDFFHHPHKALEGIWYDMDLWSYWHKITCPILVIRGENSELLTPMIIKKMCRTHPMMDVCEIADAGHAPALLTHYEHDMIYDWLNNSFDF